MSDKKLCFVLMPFKDKFKSAWNYGIKKAAKNNNLDDLDFDNIRNDTEHSKTFQEYNEIYKAKCKELNQR